MDLLPLLSSALSEISRLIALPRCSLCYIKLDPLSRVFCNHCLSKIKHQSLEDVTTSSCRVCRTPLVFESKSNICATCSSLLNGNIFIFSNFQYHGIIRQLIQILKYQQNIAAAKYIALSMVELLLKIKQMVPELSNRRPDMIIPAPSHKLSILKRGFNSNFFVANLISHALKIPIQELEVIDSQFYLRSKKHPLERISSGIPKFKLKKSKKRISLYQSQALVIDDVISTGATSLGIAKCLSELGAESIIILSCSRSIHFSKLCLKLLQSEGMKEKYNKK